MAEAIGGFIGGYLAGKAIQQESQLTDLKIKEAAATLSTKAFEQKALESVTDAFKNATPEIMKEGTPDKMLLKMAETAGKAGAPALAAEYLAKSAKVSEDLATASKTTLERDITSANAAVSLLEGVTDGKSLEAAYQRTQMQGIDTKGFIPMLYKYYKDNGDQWDESLQALVDSGKQAIVSAKDAARIKVDEARVKTETTRQSLLRAQASLIPTQKKEIEARTDKLKKEGTTTTKFTAADLTYAKNLLQADYQFITPEEEPDEAALAVKAQDVVDYADSLLAATPSLTRTEAVKKAYEDLKKDKHFAGYPSAARRKGSVYDPHPSLPATKEEAVVNEIYMVGGRPMLWNGDGFEPVSGRTR